MSANHGNTPAAWTAVTIALVGFVVAGIGLMAQGHAGVVFWIGMILVPVGAVVGGVMGRMGYGAEAREGH
jgi:hypothetical protein